MSRRPSESLPTSLFYELLTNVDKAAENAEPMIAIVRQETQLFLEALQDDATKILALKAKLKAHQETRHYASFAAYVDSDYHNSVTGEGFRKGEDHAEIIVVNEWLAGKGVESGTNLSEQEYAAIRLEMDAELVKYYYTLGVINYLESEIWKLEGKIAMAAGYKVSSGLKWNITGKSPYTKTDFENLMSALWEKKFITHVSDKKEQAMKALYGVFDLPIPEKTGTNRHKNKSAGTTSDKTLEIFDRLKDAQQQYLDGDSK